MFSKAFTKAADFRRQVRPHYDARLEAPYREQEVDVRMFDLGSLKHRFGLQPLSLQDANLADLVGDCRIDHSVAPVADKPGGSRAGYARWTTFKESGLDEYRRKRNNPASANGASRMSAYLHYGMVSPFRIAREAASLKANKFLDELLVWRELAFHFCFHNHDVVDSLDAVPDWAKETLDAHTHDDRDANCSWETLARANSGRPLWDAAQRSLLKHGELHNHVRMTWGKAFLPWLQTPSRAFQLSIDLNHRYALDGRNPSSYGGVLWCFGQFDRPFEPERPIIGKLRPRDVDQHAERIDLHRYTQRVDRPIAASLPRVAIIGAGIGGLAAARTLADHGIDVTVFDKSRGVGGRTATRRTDSAGQGQTLQFDHGAQYFTARDSRFCRLVNSWIHDGLAEPWMGRIVQVDDHGQIKAEKNDTPRYVGVPGMNAVAKHLAKGLALQVGNPIVELQRSSDHWMIENAGGQKHGPFDVVLCNCPPPQTSKLIDGHTHLADVVRSVQMRPCWAMMVADRSLTQIPFDGAFVDDSPVSWIASNSRKPGRGNPADTVPASWVVHATADWSQQHIQEDPDQIIEKLLPMFGSILGKTIDQPLHVNAHRWMYAIPKNPLDQDCLFDSTTGIGACGDWCGGSRVEAAYLSGIALAGRLLRHYTIDRPAYREDQTRQRSLFA
jgi:predicted NAD/FAD-dependent oxidoreductase